MVSQGTVERTKWIKKVMTNDDHEVLPSSHWMFLFLFYYHIFKAFSKIMRISFQLIVYQVNDDRN